MYLYSDSRRWALAALLLALTFSISAQTVTVRDATTLRPLSSVTITTPGNVKLVFTDTRGQADVSAFAGEEVIQVSLLGYYDETMSFKAMEERGWVILLSESSYYQKEVVISASRFEEKRDDVAQQVQVISSRDAQFQSQQTSADLLQQTGNVFVQKSQMGGGSPVLRGFEASRVLLVVDGVRMNNAIYRSGHLQDVITLDNTNVDKVEVLFGPGSVVYGSDALGGVMHFFTRNPEFSENDQMFVRAGAFTRYATANQEMTGHVDFNLGGQRFASLTSLTFSDFGDLRQGNVRSPFNLGNWARTEYVETINGIDSVVANPNPNMQVGSAYRQYDLLQKFAFRQSETVLHILNFQYSTSSNVPRYDRLTQYRNGAPRFAEWYYGPQDRMLVAYHLNLTGKTRFYDESRITLSYQDIQQSRNSRRFRSPILESQVEDVAVVALNADFAKPFKGGHELRYGAEFTYNDVTSTAWTKNGESGESLPFTTRYPDGGSAMQTSSVYMTHAWEVNSWLVLNDGLRFTQTSVSASFSDTTFYPFPFSSFDNDNSSLNGSLGAIIKLHPTWRINLIGSTGFRVPNVDDLSKVFESAGATRDEDGNLIELGTLIVPNPALKPERTYNLDLGIEKVFDEVVTLGVTGFYTLYDNALTTQAGTLNGQEIVIYSGDSAQVITPSNAGRGFLYGGNVQLIANVNKQFSFSSSLNYTYGRITIDDAETPLDHIPPVFGKTSFNLQMNKFRGEFFVMYSGWKRLEDYRLGAEDNEANATSVGMPAWYTLNVRTSYPLSENIQLQVAMENILDMNYRTFSSNISAPGRNLMVTLRGHV